MAEPSSQSSQHQERERSFGAAKLIAAITLLSRCAGLLRDLVQAWLFGVTRVTDAFNLAFIIPNLFRRLFGEGALSAALVPVFTEVMELQGRQKAAALLANVLGLLGLLLCGLCLLIELGLLAFLFATPEQGAENISRRLLLGYTGIMLPFMITICLLAVGSAALNCVGHFAYPAAAPIVLNVGIIIANVWLARYWHTQDIQLGIVAASVVVSGVLQLVLLIWVLKAHNLPFMPKLWPIQPGVRKILTLMLPMLLPLGLLQFNSLFDGLLAWLLTATKESPTLTILGVTLYKPLQEGVVTVIGNAQRIYQFPLGVLVTALGTAIFPLFSRYAARGETDNLRDSVNRALRLAMFEGLPSGVGMILLAGPLTALLFAWKNFTPQNAASVAHVVTFYGLGVWAFCCQQILLRAFYAQKDTRTPLKVACWLVGVNFLLNLALIWIPWIRQGAFGLSTSITGTINVIILAVILRRRLGRMGLRSLLTSVARIAIATLAMGLAVWFSQDPLAHLAGGGKLWPNLARVFGGIGAGMLAFFLVCILLRAPELRELLGRSRKTPVAAPGGEKSTNKEKAGTRN